jgi:hypothetical protein
MTFPVTGNPLMSKRRGVNTALSRLETRQSPSITLEIPRTFIRTDANEYGRIVRMLSWLLVRLNAPRGDLRAKSEKRLETV